MNQILTFLIARGQEASTWTSLAVMLGGLGLKVESPTYTAIAHTLAAVCALVGTLMKEHGPHNDPKPTTYDAPGTDPKP
jgi:hypothetical protein